MSSRSSNSTKTRKLQGTRSTAFTVYNKVDPVKAEAFVETWSAEEQFFKTIPEKLSKEQAKKDEAEKKKEKKEKENGKSSETPTPSTSSQEGL